MAIVGVMGSGKVEWAEFTAPLAVWLAENGFDLLTGGGQGVMLSASRAFHGTIGRTGKSVGVLPTRPDDRLGFVPLDGYPNPFIEIPILTPLPRKNPDAPEEGLSRNHVNILTSDVVVALPGGHGTLDEIRLALRFGKPIIGFGPRAEFPATAIPVVSTLGEVTDFVRKALSDRP
jgi:uncharacterized protein (TIGR00725 family)